MIKKVKKAVKKELKQNYKFYIFMLCFLLLFIIKFDYYIYSNGGLTNLETRIKVDSTNKEEGSFNLTYVTSRDGSIINILLSYIIPTWDLESVDSMRIQDEDPSLIEIRDKIYLKETSYDAVIAAFKEANIPYQLDSIDLTVSYVFKDANTDLKAEDIIKGINDDKVETYKDISNALSKYNEGDEITIKVIRNKKEITCHSKLIKSNDKVVIGVSLAEIKNVSTNPKVEYIFKRNESGASRGLMCALEIYNKITEFDLTKGRVIAGTGSIDSEGNIGSISGVKYKLKGAVNNKADIFIVPSENYKEAMKIKEENKFNIEIIEADNLHNVIEKLK